MQKKVNERKKNALREKGSRGKRRKTKGGGGGRRRRRKRKRKRKKKVGGGADGNDRKQKGEKERRGKRKGNKKRRERYRAEKEYRWHRFHSVRKTTATLSSWEHMGKGRKRQICHCTAFGHLRSKRSLALLTAVLFLIILHHRNRCGGRWRTRRRYGWWREGEMKVVPWKRRLTTQGVWSN